MNVFGFVEPSIGSALQESIQELARHWKLSRYPVIVVGTTSDPEHIPASVLSCFKHEISFEVRHTNFSKICLIKCLGADRIGAV